MYRCLQVPIRFKRIGVAFTSGNSRATMITQRYSHRARYTSSTLVSSKEANQKRPWEETNSSLPMSYWTLEHQREYLLWVANQLGFNGNDPANWYNVKKSDVSSRGANNFLNHKYHGYLCNALTTAFPEIEWHEWEFSALPPEFWENKDNARRYLQWVTNKLGYTSFEDWYSLKSSDLTKKGGGPLRQYGKTLPKALPTLFPEHTWLPWKFGRVEPGFWKSIENQKIFLEEVGKDLGIQSLEDWYPIESAQLITRGIYFYPLSLTLQETLYPDFPWNLSKFSGDLESQWEDPEAAKRFLKFIEKKLGITSPSDWYLISTPSIIAHGGEGLLRKYSGLVGALTVLYPNEEWKEELFQEKTEEAIKEYIKRSMEQALPPQPNSSETRYEEHEDSLSYPTLKLAFNTYTEAEYNQGAKFELAQKLPNGTTLLTIPYWWHGDTPSLVATIHKAAPGLPILDISPEIQPISPKLPRIQVRKCMLQLWPVVNVPKHQLRLQKDYLQIIYSRLPNPILTTRWLSEKLDGVRAFWDGLQLYSKQGCPIHAPKWFYDLMPRNVALDGELWGGKGKFQNTCSIVVKRMKAENIEPENDEAWKKLTFHIFDAPKFPGKFEERIEFARQMVGDSHPIMRLVSMRKCLGKPDLEQALQQIADKGGEGVMLRQPGCEYSHGRSTTLLKVKFFSETEVKMLGLNHGGKSLVCEALNGEMCIIPCSLYDFLNPPPVGSGKYQRVVASSDVLVLTIRHVGFTKEVNGKPRYPYFLRVRRDATWEGLKREKQEEQRHKAIQNTSE